MNSDKLNKYHSTRSRLESEQQRYMLDFCERIDRVLAVVGERPGALAKVYCSNFVAMAKRAGATRKDAEKLLAQMWERFDAHEKTEDVLATVGIEVVDDGN